MSEVLGKAVEGGVLFFEKAFHIGGEFVFVAEKKIVGVEENFLRVGFGKSDFALDGDEHGRGLSRGRCRWRGGLDLKRQGDGFDAEDSSAQNGFGPAIGGDDFVGRRGQELVDGGGGKALFDAVAGGFVFQGRNGNHMNGLGERVVVAGDTVAAP